MMLLITNGTKSLDQVGMPLTPDDYGGAGDGDTDEFLGSSSDTLLWHPDAICAESFASSSTPFVPPSSKCSGSDIAAMIAGELWRLHLAIFQCQERDYAGLSMLLAESDDAMKEDLPESLYHPANPDSLIEACVGIPFIFIHVRIAIVPGMLGTRQTPLFLVVRYPVKLDYDIPGNTSRVQGILHS